MNKRGSILPYIVILIVAVIVGNWLYNKYSRLPSKLTQDTAVSIFKYPNAETWIVENKKGLCVFASTNCSLSSNIRFTSKDNWNTVYLYHIRYMSSLGWKTNSQVYTSTPTGVLFTNDLTCQAELTPKRNGILEFSDSKSGQYFIKVTCPA